MIWDIMADKLVAANLGVIGQSIFVDEMPGDVTQGVMFKTPLQGIAVDPNIKGLYKPNLQVIVRHTDPLLGARLADQVKDALTVEGPQEFTATADRKAILLHRFYPSQLPIRFPRLDGNGLEWSLNFFAAFAVLGS